MNFGWETIGGGCFLIPVLCTTEAWPGFTNICTRAGGLSLSMQRKFFSACIRLVNQLVGDQKLISFPIIWDLGLDLDLDLDHNTKYINKKWIIL